MTADRPWPPVIEFGRASAWVRIRDILLTAAAWARLLYLMRAGLGLIIDYFSYPVFELTGTHSPDWLEVWNRMSTFLILSVVAMLWLVLWGLIHRRRLQLAAHATPPSSLPLDRHAASFNFAAGDIEEWRKLKVAIVQFDGNHRITSAAASASAAQRAAASANGGARGVSESPWHGPRLSR